MVTRRLFQRLSVSSASTNIPPTSSTEEPTISTEPSEPTESTKQESNLAILFMLLVVFRIYNGLLVITWFDPDETWQSVEVAHEMIFGNGGLTWEWKLGIRSSLHPLLFASYFKLLKILQLADTMLLIKGPRLIQALFSATSDFYAFSLACKLFGPEAGKFTLFCMLCNWFNFYCGIRTYSNSIEASLTMVALYYWPFPRLPTPTRSDLRIALAIAAITCIIRPTSLLVWFFLGFHLLSNYPHRSLSIIFDAITTGIFVLACSVGIDYIYYGKWILVQWFI
jgi:phosphatidylinositol glycan class B